MTLCIQVIIPLNDPPIARPTEVGRELEDRKGGFPHSEICGSKGARTSPQLIAACHVLLRLSTPRHPSEALMRLIVLSKTHARRGSRRSRSRPAPDVNAPPGLCYSIARRCLSIRSALEALEKPGRPFIHDVNATARPSRSCDAHLAIAGRGGARRVRTDDLMLAKHALYQLSYGPSSRPPRGASSSTAAPRCHT